MGVLNLDENSHAAVTKGLRVDENSLAEDKPSVEVKGYAFTEVVEEGSPVKPGDVLIRSRPFIYAIKPDYRNKVCENCLTFNAEWGGIVLCRGCEAVGYCSEGCRLNHLPAHKVECELCILRNRRVWPHRAWFVSRAILRVQAEGYNQLENINKLKSRAFGDLMDHYDDINNDNNLGECWFQEVSSFLGTLMPEKEEYMRIYGRLTVNSFALRVDNNGEEENIGTALYRAASILDHSCNPTATTVFNPGGVLEVKSMVSSSSLDLSSFHISYLDEADQRLSRLAKLSQTWFFDCGCSRCLDVDSETSKHAALCKEPECRGEVNVNIETWTWKSCSACSKPLDEVDREKYKEVHEMVRTIIDENGGDCPFVDVAEFLVRQMEPLFHPSDLEVMQAALSAAQGHYASKNWKKALYYQELASHGFRRYYDDYSGFVGPGLQRLAECYHHTGQTTAAQNLIQEAQSILEKVPGADSFSFNKYFKPVYHLIMHRGED